MAAFELSAIRGPLVGRGFPIGDGALWFGRTPDAPIPVASHLASRRHAEIRVENGTPVLRDLNSANGTRLNGERVQTRALGVGDVIEIGDEAFRVGASDAPTLPQRGALVAVRGPLAGRSFPLEDRPLTLGRALDSSIVLHSQRASRRHAEVRSEARGACLYDLGSGNGTYVNGARATWRFLAGGDTIEIGEEAFRFEPPAMLPAVPSAQSPHTAARVASPLAQSIPGEESWTPHRAPAVKGTVPIPAMSPQPPPIAQTHPSPMGPQPVPTMPQPAPMAYPQPAYPAQPYGHPAYPPPQPYPQAPYAQPPYAPPQPAPPPPPAPPPQHPVAPPPPGAQEGAPTFGVMCPKCRRVVDARYQDCPWDGTSLVNGRSLA